jgi:hypothetical protein
MPKRGPGDRGGARGSWRLQASVLSALHRHAKASGRGTGIEARRSDSSRSTSFDEAAVQTGLVVPPQGARQRASAAGKRPSRWLKRPRRGRAARKAFDQEPTGPSGAGPEGNRRTSRARPKLEGRRQAGLHPRSCRHPGLDLEGDRGSRPRTRKRTRKVIRESSGSHGCSCRVVGCRSRNEASSWPGQSAPQGEPSLDEVA